AEDGIRDRTVTGVQTCALPILLERVDLEVHALEHLARAEGIADADEPQRGGRRRGHLSVLVEGFSRSSGETVPALARPAASAARSEERRVGRAGRSRRARWRDE